VRRGNRQRLKAAATPKAQGAAAAAAAAAKGKAKPGSGGGGTAKAKAKLGDKPAGKDVATFAKVAKDAVAMKLIWIKVMSQADSLIAVIENGDVKFSFAQNTQNVGKLKELLEAATTRLSPFDKEFLVKDLKQMKQCYGTPHLEVELAKFQKLGGFAFPVQQMSDRIIKRSQC
jgi:hypothetical protein